MTTQNEIVSAPTFLTLDNFLSMTQKFGPFAKSCRFIARIVPEGRLLNSLAARSDGIMRDLQYLCEATEFPGRGFMNMDVRYYGPKFKLPFMSEYEDVNMTFICRSDSPERRFFDDWQTAINPVNQFDFNYRDDYCARIELFHFSEEQKDDNNIDPKASYSFRLNKAYPILVNQQNITWADGEFLRLGVSFTYTWWDRPDSTYEQQSIQSSDGSAPYTRINGPSNTV